jgi:hypothetical protein
VLSLQSEVASAIATQIRVKLTPQQHAAFREEQFSNPEAQDLYLKAQKRTILPRKERLTICKRLLLTLGKPSIRNRREPRLMLD